MLLDYVETPILRKINLVHLLFYSDKQTVDHLALKLDCATLTLLEDVNYLKNDLNINIEIITTDDGNEALILHDTSDTFHQTLQKIYATSAFLQFFTYFFDEDHGPFSKFITNNHLSTATGYRLRRDIRNFAESVGLYIANNTLQGRGVLLRFLAIELYRNFSVHLLEEDPLVTSKSQKILDEMEQILNIHFSYQERNMFNLLIQTSVQNLYNKNGLGLSRSHLNSIHSNIYPQQLKTLLQDNFMDYWQNPAEELDFCILAFITINSHVFDSSVPPEIIQANKKAFNEHPDIKNLIDLFYERFTINEQLIEYFYTSLYLFVRDSAFGIQPFTITNLQLNEPHTVTYRRIIQILNEWNSFNISFERYHIITLYNRLAPLLSLSLYKNIVIVSDKQIDANFISDYIKILVGEEAKITLESSIDKNYPLLEDEYSIFIIDKSADITLPTDLMRNCFYTTFPIDNSQIVYMLNKLNLL